MSMDVFVAIEFAIIVIVFIRQIKKVCRNYSKKEKSKLKRKNGKNCLTHVSFSAIFNVLVITNYCSNIRRKP